MKINYEKALKVFCYYVEISFSTPDDFPLELLSTLLICLKRNLTLGDFSFIQTK